MKTVTLTAESIHAGDLILVNAHYPYVEDALAHRYVPVHPMTDTILLEHSAVKALAMLMEELDGWNSICAVSGWRSREEQQEIYTQSLAEHGEEFTAKFVALPGCSEHQTGFAIDLGLKQDSIDFICPDFPYTGICQSFRERASSFGFIERYPRGKENITGIAHEPWHFRYVGTPHAEIMAEHDLALEEYHDFLKQYRYGQKHYLHFVQGVCFSVSFLEARPTGDTQFEIDAHIPFSVSGNNMDGFIITERREQNEK